MTALGFLYRAVDHVRSSLEYRLGTTTVNSSVAEVLAGGSGVCQDFAHVLISLCRNVGLPARYVSGYLGGVEESTASHAWAEAYVPPYGWVGVDATLGTRCTGRHVKVGIGRDYADVAVLTRHLPGRGPGDARRAGRRARRSAASTRWPSCAAAARRSRAWSRSRTSARCASSSAAR